MGIFFDVLPRLDMVAANAVLTQVTNIFGKAGREIGTGMSAAAREAAAMQTAMIAAANAADAAAIRAERMEYAVNSATRRLTRAQEAAAAATTPGMSARAADREAAAIENAAIAAQNKALADRQAAQAAERSAATSDAYAAAAGRAALKGNAAAAAISSVGAAVTGVTALMGGIGINNAKNFEYGLASVGSASDLSTQQIKGLHDGLLQLTTKYGTSMNELLDGSRILTRFGGIFRDSATDVKVMNTALQASIMDKVPVADVLAAVAGSATNFNLTVDETVAQIAKLKTAAGEFPTGNVASLSRAMGVVEPFAATYMGHSVASADQTLAFLTRLGTQNITPENAGDIAKNSMRSLGAPNNQQAQALGGLLSTITNPATGKPMTLSDFSAAMHKPEDQGGGIMGAYGILGRVMAANTHMTADGREVVKMPLYQTNQGVLNNLLRVREGLTSPEEQQLMSAAIDNMTSPLPDDQLAVLRRKMSMHRATSPQFRQAMELFNKAGGFSAAAKGSIDSAEMDPSQVIKLITGTSLNLQGFQAIAGSPEAQARSQQTLSDIHGSRPDADGNLSGWADMAKTAQVHLNALKGEMKALSIEVGEKLLPSFNHFVDLLTKGASFLNQHKGILDGILRLSEDIAIAWSASKILGAMGRVIGLAGQFKTTLVEAETTAGTIGPALERGVVSSTGRSMTALGRLGAQLSTLKGLAGSIVLSDAVNRIFNAPAGSGGPDWAKGVGEGLLGAAMFLPGPAKVPAAVAGGLVLGADGLYHLGQSSPDAQRFRNGGPVVPDPGAHDPWLAPPGMDSGNAAGPPMPMSIGEWARQGMPALPDASSTGIVPGADAPPFGADDYLPYDPSILSGGGGSGGGGDVDAASLPGYINPSDYAVPIGSAGMGLPPGRFSEEGLQRDTVGVLRAVEQAFPQIKSIGGWRKPDGFNEHSSGEALDIMMPNGVNDVALGNQISNWLLQHAEELGIDYTLWQQAQHNPDGSVSPMGSRNGGDPTANHMDHVHVRTKGGGYPTGNEQYAMPSGSMPLGTMADPFYFLPGQGFPGINENYNSPGGGNPLMGALSAGPMQGAVKLMTMFFANMALGNPIGQGALGKISPYAWWYQQPGGQNGMGEGMQSLQGLNKEQLQNVKNTNALKLAYMQLNEAMASGKPDRIAKAQMHLQNVQAGQALQGGHGADVSSWNSALKRYHQHPTQENWDKLQALSTENGFDMPDRGALGGGAISSSDMGASAGPANVPGAGGGEPGVATPGDVRGGGGGGGAGGGISFPSEALNGNPEGKPGLNPQGKGHGPLPFPTSGPAGRGFMPQPASAGALPGMADRGEGMMPRATTQPGAMMDQPKGSPIGGGLLGAAEGAAIAAAGMTPAGPAGSMAAQLAIQEANLAVGKIGDLAANMLVNMPLETFTLHGPDGKSGDLSQTLPFRLLGSFMQSHPNIPNTAGQNGPPETQAPMQEQTGEAATQQRQRAGGNINIENQNFYGDHDSNSVNKAQGQVMQAPSFTARGV